MRKIIFCSFLLFGISGFAAMPGLVEYRINRVHGLVKFAFAISGRPHEAENLVELFRRSEFAQRGDVLEAIRKIEASQPGLENGLNFPDAVSNRSDGMDVASFVNMQSILLGIWGI